MRIAVLNYAPHVGKSTLTRHLLLPRIPGAELFEIDSYHPLDSESMWDLMCGVIKAENIVVDVPYWQTPELIQAFRTYVGSQEDFDVFVIPTTAESAVTVQKTVVTIAALKSIGVPATKIRPVFNCIERATNMSRAFSSLYQYWKEEKGFVLNATAVIHNSGIFRQFEGIDLTFAQLLETSADSLWEVARTDGIDDRCVWGGLISTKRMVPGVMAELDVAFRTLVE